MPDKDTQFTDEYFREKLTPKQYNVLREAGTEPAFSGAFVKNKEPGMYTCAACGQQLFSSNTKFESHTGWPSFYDVVKEGNVVLQEDTSHSMNRIEVLCSNCKSHLGHVFDDGPKPTGKRFCITCLSLDFKPGEQDAVDDAPSTHGRHK